jgi:type I restriction enzyme M protein
MFELTFKNIDDLLRTTDCQTELDYVEQTSWIIFLKYLDDLDTDRQTTAKLIGGAYTPLMC